MIQLGVLALGALLVPLLVGCGTERAATEARTGSPPSILLVTLDTTRADRIGAYGYDRAVTPTLDRLAREGVLFEFAIAPTPITLPSHASILTGVYPPAHGVRDNLIFQLEPDAVLVSEALQRHGWRTAAFVGAFVLDARFGLAQGFEVYRAPQIPTATPTRKLLSPDQVERPANEVVDDAIAWLSRLGPDERFFVWVHFFDPHQPYVVVEGWEQRFADPYDAEIGFCDAQLGRLLAYLESRGLVEDLLTVVTSDHGEALGEHGEETHGILLYQSTLRVPLLLSGRPVQRARGTRVAHPVSTADLPATLLALAGLDPEALPRSVLPPLISSDGDIPAGEGDREIDVETLLPYLSFRWSASRGLLWRGDKLIDGARAELYHLEEDPEERVNLAEAEPERVARLRARLGDLLESQAALGWGRQRGVESGEPELLEALGYVQGSVGEDPFAAWLPDPAERIGDVVAASQAHRHLSRALALLPDDPQQHAAQDPRKIRRGRRLLARAKTVLEELRVKDPGNPMHALRLGMAEQRLGNHAAAIELLEYATRLQPQGARVHYDLALAYQAAGRGDDARREMRAALSLRPDVALYRRWLAEHAPEG